MKRFYILLLILVNGCAQVDLSEQVATSYCSDSFNRDDADSLGANWSFLGLNNQTIAAAIRNQGASITSPGGGFTYASCRQNVQQKNVTVSVRFTPAQNFASQKVIGIVARSQSTGSLTDTYICGMEHNGASAKLALYKGVNTLRTDLAISSTTQSITGGTEYGLSFSAAGSQMSCSLAFPGTDTVTATDATFSTGYVGMFAWSIFPANSVHYTFDDFKVEVRP